MDCSSQIAPTLAAFTFVIQHSISATSSPQQNHSDWENSTRWVFPKVPENHYYRNWNFQPLFSSYNTWEVYSKYCFFSQEIQRKRDELHFPPLPPLRCLHFRVLAILPFASYHLSWFPVLQVIHLRKHYHLGQFGSHFHLPLCFLVNPFDSLHSFLHFHRVTILKHFVSTLNSSDLPPYSWTEMNSAPSPII